MMEPKQVEEPARYTLDELREAGTRFRNWWNEGVRRLDERQAREQAEQKAKQSKKAG